MAPPSMYRLKSPVHAGFVLKGIGSLEHGLLYQKKQTSKPPMQSARGSLEKGQLLSLNGASLWLDAMASETPNLPDSKRVLGGTGQRPDLQRAEGRGRFAARADSCFKGSQSPNKTCLGHIFHFLQDFGH